MAAYTSTQAGNWSDPASWGGSGVPGVGDTATILHDIVVAANVSVGDDPADETTYGVVVDTAGTLTINTGVTLTCRTNMQLDPSSVNNTLTIDGNGKLLFDGSQVSATQNRRLRCEFRARIYLNGTDANNRATIEANELGGYFQFSVQGAAPSLTSLDWALIKRCGNGANRATTSNNYAFNAGETITWRNTLCEDCGQFRFRARFDTNTITLEDVEFIQPEITIPSDANGIHMLLESGVSTAVVTINRCVIGQRFYTTKSSSVRVNNTYFGAGFFNLSTAGNAGWAAGSANNLFVHAHNNVATVTWHGSFEDTYYFHHVGDGLNYFTINIKATAAGEFIRRNIMDYGTTSPSQPDGISVAEVAAGRDLSILQNIVLPDTAGVSSGAWINHYSPTLDGTVRIEHNTFVSAYGSGGQTGTYVGENGWGRTGMITSFQSNLAWTPPGKVGGFKMFRHTSSTIQDFVSSANADYNWSWNIAPGSEGNGYNCANTATSLFSSGTPDSNGGTGDPDFVDTSRNLLRFDRDFLGNSAATPWADATTYSVGDVVSASTLGFADGDTLNWRCITPHTSASADATNGKPGEATGFRENWEPMSLYRLREDPTRIVSLIDWVRAGFGVQNSALRDAGHDSVTIGAQEFAGPVGSPQYHFQQIAAAV